MKRKLWLVTGALLAVAAVEFGLVRAGSASAFFPWQHRRPDPPACGRSFLPCRPTATPTRAPTSTPAPPPVSPPVCLPDAEHGHDAACEGQPASMQLTPDPLTIHCDGAEQSRVTVRVTDSRGRAVPDGTYVYFSPYNGSANPYFAQTHNGVASTYVRFYSDIFPYGPNVIVDAGPLEAGVRIRCFPESNQGPVSPPACDPSGASPPSAYPPCPTPTPTSTPGCWPASPPCATPTPRPSWPCDPSGASPPSVAPLCGGELGLSGPSGAQAVGASFDVTLSIKHAWQAWGMYQADIAYDTSVLHVTDVTRLPIAGCNDLNWDVPQTAPTIIVRCMFQSSTDTGPVDTITFQCLKDGSSELHLVTPAEDSIQGSTLYDVSTENIGTYLTDGPTVTCGSGGTQTPTPTGTALVATLTATAKTALAGWTETAQASAATNTPTVTPVPTATDTPVPVVTATPTGTPTP